MKEKLLITFFVLAITCTVRAEENAEKIFYKKVVDIAKSSVGLRKIPPVNGKSFSSDCIGFVNYVYFKAGLDLVKTYGHGKRGVDSLFYGLKKYGFIYVSKDAHVGDLIFFDNTYDANHNGKWDDNLSHIGIIIGKGKYGTLYYVHYASSGVKVSKINLYYPNTYAFRKKDGSLLVINSFLRKDRGERFSKRKYISSSFYRAFAHIKVKMKK